MGSPEFGNRKSSWGFITGTRGSDICEHGSFVWRAPSVSYSREMCVGWGVGLGGGWVWGGGGGGGGFFGVCGCVFPACNSKGWLLGGNRKKREGREWLSRAQGRNLIARGAIMTVLPLSTNLREGEKEAPKVQTWGRPASP